MTLLALIVAATAWAQGPGDGRGNENRPGDRKERMIAALDLTQEQVDQFEQLRLDHWKATKKNKDALKLKMVELETIVTDETPDTKKINSLVNDINDLRAKEFAAKIDHRLEMRALLDENQKIEFDQWHRRKMAGRHHKKGRRG